MKLTWLNRNVWGMGLASLFGDMSYEMVSAVLPLFVTTILGAPAVVLGLIEGISDGVATLFEIGSGWYSDRIGKRKGLVVFGTVVIVFSKASFALLTRWWQLLIARTLGWIGWAVRRPARDALLVESVDAGSVGQAFAFHRAMDRIGGIIGPFIAAALLLIISPRAIFLLTLVPGFAAIASLVWLVEEQPHQPVPATPLQSVRALPAPFLRFLLPVGIFGIANFAPTMLILRTQQLLGLFPSGYGAAASAVVLYGISNLVYVLASYPVGFLADRVALSRLLGIGYLLFGVVCFGFMKQTPSLWLLVTLFVLHGIALALVKVTQPAMAARLMLSSQRGFGFGALSAVTGFGELVSSILIGLLWSSFSPEVGFATSGIIAWIASLVMVALYQRVTFYP